MFGILMSDNVKARVMLSDGTYVHADKAENEEPLNAQEYFYEEAYRKAAEKKIRQERLRENREKGADKSSKKKKKSQVKNRKA